MPEDDIGDQRLLALRRVLSFTCDLALCFYLLPNLLGLALSGLAVLHVRWFGEPAFWAGFHESIWLLLLPYMMILLNEGLVPGGSPFKRLFRLRVVGVTGDRTGYRAAWLRGFGKAICVAIAFLGPTVAVGLLIAVSPVLFLFGFFLVLMPMVQLHTVSFTMAYRDGEAIIRLFDTATGFWVQVFLLSIVVICTSILVSAAPRPFHDRLAGSRVVLACWLREPGAKRQTAAPSAR